MKRSTLILFLLLSVFSVTSVAQSEKKANKADPVDLAEQEIKVWQGANDAEKKATDALNEAFSRVASVKLSETTAVIGAVSEFQTASANLNAIRAQKGGYLSELRLKYECTGCTISEDGKKLNKPGLPPPAK